ncbi:MAG TPA: SDR family oxidoreductase [bacterium]|nr:SDR family oxidoreductase [Candidatus Omnitrophota bacterium]HOJ60706.1 SDR family oxidoreductase [bacterium]HOL94072.1 SDR family oxidoreductase [bacterium]HPP01415.1 SDR family oxidoreductase [bacterium]HXK93909.1 SDR family oxidoreductase [bacterium]
MIYTSQRKRILVTGGSGFLGWHLVKHLSKRHDVSYTYATRRVQIPRCRGFHVNFLHPSSIEPCVQEADPEVVIHAAALADTAECERAHEKAVGVNVTGTERLIRCLPDTKPLLIYISTDLVFNGLQAPYTETDEPDPLNFYGKTKRMAEQAVQRLWKNHVIVRPAILYGAPTSNGRGSFLQWMDQALSQGEPLRLFTDEYRTPVYVHDVVAAVASLVERIGQHRIYHVGGPERMSRLEIGRRLAAFRGYDPSLLRPVTQAEADTGCPRPKDVSLNSARVQAAHAVKFTPFEEALKAIFGGAEHSAGTEQNPW